jgi:hypothetical protein
MKDARKEWEERPDNVKRIKEGKAPLELPDELLEKMARDKIAQIKRLKDLEKKAMRPATAPATAPADAKEPVSTAPGFIPKDEAIERIRAAKESAARAKEELEKKMKPEVDVGFSGAAP